MTTKEELLEKMHTAVVEYEEDEARDLAQEYLDAGHDPLEGIMNGLAKGMEEVGQLFENNEYFVPEVLMCADALYAGLGVLRPHVPVAENERGKGQVVIGTIEGDVHDIGKNIVKMMFDVAGWTVHDLGKDVPLEKFVEEQLKTESEVVALSAMMTTTMLGMQKVIKMIKEKNPNVQILLGGAPVTQDVAGNYGADGYADNASNAVTEAINMVSKLREIESDRKK
ncbi:corrinoid protein of di/trimethylamine methyltransferase [Desulfosalsimonas propionicica]|jgi:corrinoid protein of di/trimethylamine methyltransferase|uniref:Corrinoid protein of di/trimethylamine methyltransferase n=1 Tax=Desulfosalsimonas propionicica TaxID=332175 RepID=A0A7W0CBP7_9BACT|nr:corrinoid protein [Desulfosalsimonas propionicica]MBA2882806.1 corrinoid protein of di/trimethylamine methyltransferase [Desulfosalsimonas propionicica]